MTLGGTAAGPRPRGTQGPGAPQHRVLPGIDVLLTDSLHLIAGKRLGLITNQTGVDAEGVPTIDRLFRAAAASPAPQPLLVALFAPEHGIRGTYAPGESVRDSVAGAGDTVDVATGLPIYSLYGPRRAPTAAQLDSLDVLLVDLQDVGTRTFTFVSTMVHAMRAAAAAHRRIIVLDRPDPIGCAVQGPVLEPANASFIGMLPVPLRHGMTIGELARFANRELRIGADLVVVPVRGWSRCMWFEETGLPWVRPSPNLPDLRSLAWYPGTVLFEATNLSVGRGTDAPFRQVGATWLDAPRVARLVPSRLAGLSPTRFTPFQPGDGKYGNVTVNGVVFPAYTRAPGLVAQCLAHRRAPPATGRGCESDPVEAALALLDAVRRTHPDSLVVDAAGLTLRLGVRPSAAHVSPARLAGFLARRSRYLLYR